MTTSCTCPAEAGAASCELTAPAGDKVPCPACQNVGKAVDSVTLKALLAVPLTEISDASYRFCKTPGCAIVYYAEDRTQRFDESALREVVFQKHPDGDDTFVCYCFRHTVGSIRREIEIKHSSTAVEFTTIGIQAGRCACDLRNPQGSCCLGNVRTVVERMLRKSPE